MNARWVSLVSLLLGLLVASTSTGCVTKAHADAQARAAYQAGRRAALAEQANQGPVVQVVGDVENHVIPWTEDLTLIQALVAADYQGVGDPSSIAIIRNGEQIPVNPELLLHRQRDQDMPLEAGDRIEIRP
jgi:hypothetical protein